MNNSQVLPNVPIRTCIVTRERLPQNQLIRISIVNDIVQVVTMRKIEHGRSVYIKPEIELLEQAIKKGRITFGLKLKRSLTQSEIDRLREDFGNIIG